MEKPEPVRLRPAYSWECRCGAKNWEWQVETREVEIDGSPLLLRQPPRAVRCRLCGEAFAAEGG